MRRLALLLATLAAAGCMGGDEATFEAKELDGMVLQQADLPEGWIRFDEGRQVRADAPRGERADPRRFGREEGWKARYRRPGSAQTRGPLVVESRADVFTDADGARDELETHRDEVAADLLERHPDLGDEAFAATFRQGSGRLAVRFYLIVWRDENVTASVFVNGFEGKLTLAQSVELARKQQRRIARASE